MVEKSTCREKSGRTLACQEAKKSSLSTVINVDTLRSITPKLLNGESSANPRSKKGNQLCIIPMNVDFDDNITGSVESRSHMFGRHMFYFNTFQEKSTPRSGNDDQLCLIP